MPSHLRLGLRFGAVIAVLFVALIGYAIRVGPKMSRDSQRALDAFYGACQKHDYARAYALMAPELRDSLSQSDLAARWQAFERTNGQIARWAPAAGGSVTCGGRVCLFPPFVDYTHRVLGQKPSTLANATVVYARLVPRDGGWRIQRLRWMR